MFTTRQLKFNVFHKSKTLLNRLYCVNETVNKQIHDSGGGGEVNKYPRMIFSGIQPTGSVHIGNYLGAIRQWVDLQEKREDMILSIVDLHAITLPQEPKTLQQNIMEITATLLACGIDPDKSTLFLQSSVPQHAQLCWLLECITTMARLGRLPQFKEKSQKSKEIPLGLYVYPVLQAADILLYKATHVPVGEDQLQHLQMAQQIVKTFNHRFGNTFPSPHPLVEESICRIKSLRDPSKKMSKSDPDIKSRILLTDTDEMIHKKFRKAVTDFTPQITYDVDARPGISNMINIHSAFTGALPEEICEEMDGKDTVAYKCAVAEVVCGNIGPIREKIRDYLSHPEYILQVLETGRTKALKKATITYDEVISKVGLAIPQYLVIKKHSISSET